MPVDFDHGYDSRVTTNFTVGTGPNSEPFKIIIDTGSSDFWLSHLIYFLAINPNAHHRYGDPKQLSTTAHNISSSWGLVMSQYQQNTTPHSHLPLSWYQITPRSTHMAGTPKSCKASTTPTILWQPSAAADLFLMSNLLGELWYYPPAGQRVLYRGRYLW
jgi:hypothetical protein